MSFSRVVAGAARWAPCVVLAVLVSGTLGGCVWPFEGGGAAEPEVQVITGPAQPEGGPLRVQVDLGGGNTIGAGVNSYLWRASLDTIAFMPLASADPYGGVIITDWRATPDNPNERFKMTVYVLDPELRADGLKVSVFRQTLRVSGIWADAPVDPTSATKIENSILSRARQIRLRASLE